MLIGGQPMLATGYTLSERVVELPFKTSSVMPRKNNSSYLCFKHTPASADSRCGCKVQQESMRIGKKHGKCNQWLWICYIKIPAGTLIEIDEIQNYPHENLVIITTGSQGEPMSALSRMASSDHRKIEIIPGDMVIISANPIPGNEKLISKVINQLFSRGAEVIYESLADIHVSGHASQEELKLIHTLVKPKFFIPVHGEYRHLKQHANLAESLGMPRENIKILDIGDVVEFTPDSCNITGSVSAGGVLVDGLGIGDVGNIVLRDRRHFSGRLDGGSSNLIQGYGVSVAGPDIISRGFVYVRESEQLMEDAREVVREILEECEENQVTDWGTLKYKIKAGLRSFLYERTKRNPMILPIIMEI